MSRAISYASRIRSHLCVCKQILRNARNLQARSVSPFTFASLLLSFADRLQVGEIVATIPSERNRKIKALYCTHCEHKGF